MLKMKSSRFLILQFCVLAAILGSTYACHGTLIASGITGQEREIILQEHNRLRQTVATGRYPGQPGAENMREIIWDEELAQKAQQWANNCQFRHDPHRTINRFTMGQNLAIIWSTVPLDPTDGDFPSRIQSWFNEVQKYSFGDAWSPKTGHYSQLVWGETSLVGCGFAEYKDKTKYNKLYVCNYGPGGNVVGYTPYEVGKPACGSYGMRPSPRYNGLCAAPDPRLVSDNAIETYEYSNSNSYNSYSAFNSKQSTQYTSSSNTLYNNNNGNNNYNNNNRNSNSNSHNSYNHNKQQQTITYSNTYNNNQQATSAQASSATTAAAATGVLQTSGAHGGYSFGTQAFGGAQAYSTEAAQRQQTYHSKLEAYKPSAEEFKRAVFKHTILRTSVDGAAEQAQTQTPGRKGWSLSTWSG